MGFIEGENVALELRSAENQRDRLPALVDDLIRRQVAVIVGNQISALVAKAATTTVPIVFTGGSDPIRDGLVASLNRPAGNITGVSFFVAELGAKRLELLRQLVPNGTTIAMLVNQNSPDTEAERRDVQATALAIGQKLIVLEANSEREIDAVFPMFSQRGAGALLVGTGAYFNSNRKRLVTLAAHHALPASYTWREAILDGGLMSYGASITDAYRQVGIYAARILKGEKPGEMPVVQSTKFELVINLNTARTLGLKIPSSLLSHVDEVIE
jgi:putative ABC transport system substrate-binding protein